MNPPVRTEDPGLSRRKPSSDGIGASSELESKGVAPKTTASAAALSHLTMQANPRGISATLKINLQPYIDTYLSGDKENHKSVRNNLTEQVSGVSGAILWEKLAECALNDAISRHQLSKDEAKAITNSPIYEFMKKSFVEITKNVMDEAILGDNPQLELNLSIDASHPDRFSLILADNGRGFPVEFLKKIATLEGKDTYILGAGSEKQRVEKKLAGKEIPPLFGGAGLGLRDLMAQVVHGAELAGPGKLYTIYEKPDIAEIEFRNHPRGSGAVIEITTSRAPVKEKPEEPAMAAPIQMGAVPTKKKQSQRGFETPLKETQEISPMEPEALAPVEMGAVPIKKKHAQKDPGAAPIMRRVLEEFRSDNQGAVPESNTPKPK